MTKPCNLTPVFSEADFAYGAPGDGGRGLSLAVFADRAHRRAEIGEDAVSAGFGVAVSAGLAEAGTRSRAGRDALVIDCPEVDAATLAMLTRLDIDVAHRGASLMVSTSVDALEDVFGCLNQSHAQILVNPSRADRLIALAELRARRGPSHLRDLADEDRLMLLRLTEQVSKIAERLDLLSPGQSGGATGGEAGDAGDAANRVEAARTAFFGAGAAGPAGDRLVRPPRAPDPDPRLVRRIIRNRQLRAKFFDGDLFADPAWDMLLDLTAARAENARVSVTSLCIASGVPPTTALRWIGQMTEAKLLERVEDEADRRRAFITLTERSADAMARYFAELGNHAVRLI